MIGGEAVVGKEHHAPCSNRPIRERVQVGSVQTRHESAAVAVQHHVASFLPAGRSAFSTAITGSTATSAVPAAAAVPRVVSTNIVVVTVTAGIAVRIKVVVEVRKANRARCGSVKQRLLIG